MPRFLRFAGGAAAALAVVLATLPYWLGWVLPPIARMAGSRVGAYQRIGYRRFALIDAEYNRNQVRVRAGRAEADTPLLWLWKHLRKKDSPVFITDWLVDVRRSETPPPPRLMGMTLLHARLGRILPTVARWLPLASIGKGAVRWPGGGFSLRQADWKEGGLRTRGLVWPAGTADVAVAIAPDGTIEFEAAQASADIKLQGRWRGAQAQGRLLVWSQPVELKAQFGETGWVPREAGAQAENWQVSAERLGLGGDYSALRGGGKASWANGRFNLSIDARAEPKPGSTGSAITVKAGASGDRQGWSVTDFALETPFVRANLSSPVAFGYGGAARFTPARLSFEGDLPQLSRLVFDVIENIQFWQESASGKSAPVRSRAALPVQWLPVRGRARGELELSPGPKAAPSVGFSLTATGVGWRNVSAGSVSLKGSYFASRLTVEELDARLDGSEFLHATGACDFKSRSLDSVSIKGRLGQSWLAGFLPAGIAASEVEFAGRISGPWDNPEHSGTLRMGRLEIAPIKPLRVDGTWEGRGLSLTRALAHGSAGTTRLDLAGSVDRSGIRLAEFHFSKENSEIWRLSSPAEISWIPNLRVIGLKLRGPAAEGSIDFQGGDSGSLSLTAQGVRSEWAADLIALPGPAWRIGSLQFTGQVKEGRLIYSTSAEADVEFSSSGSGTGGGAHLLIAADGDKTGLRLTRLSMVESGRVLANAQGRLPIGWSARTVPHWQVDSEAPVELKADVESGSPAWSEIARAVGLTLEEPAIHLRLGGTLRNPIGELKGSVAHLAAIPGKFYRSIPAIDSLALSAHADRTGVAVDSLEVRVGGQPLKASGRVPMTNDRWAALFRRQAAPIWTDAEFHIDAEDAEVAPLAAYWPAVISPYGHWSAHVAFEKGQWSGEARVRGGATRPIESVGIVQDINIDLGVRGRELTVRSATATVGGQAVRLEGQVEAAPGSPLRLALELHGDGIPLVRKPGILIRAKIDLMAKTDQAGVTVISGQVALGDSLILKELRDLLPSGSRGSSRPPPYFSVDKEPFSRWPLSVEVSGDRSVRIQTALFSGTASPRFKLLGTLGDPRAVGEVRIDGGQVTFPFVTFQVQYGSVRLSQGDPFHPQIGLSAAARRYGYDLRMEARGPVDAPTMTFTSNPTMESEQVLFMVMGGQLPPQAVAATGTTTTTSGARLAQVGTYFGESLFQSLGVSGGDRLTAAPGAQVSQKGHETYTVEYRATDRWSLVGEYDEFDDYNLGVKWRVYVKGDK